MPDPPDFVIETASGKYVGIEVTESFRGSRRKSGSPVRERETLQDKLVRLFEEIYYGSHVTPMYAHFTWPFSTVERPAVFLWPLRELALTVARLVGEHASTRAGERLELGSEKLRETRLSGVTDRLSARCSGFAGPDRRDSPWDSTRSHLRQNAGIGDLQRALENKDDRADACRKRCDEAWLVVALTGSEFDRVVLLCPSAAPDHRAATLVGP